MALEREQMGPDYAIYDVSNARSVINIVPNSLREAMLGLEDKWRNLSEVELKRMCKPEVEHAKLRLQFWAEYNKAQDQGRMVQVGAVIRGVCSQEWWNSRVLRCPEKVAYIVVPPRDYLSTMAEMLDFGMDRLRDVLSLDLVDEKGRANAGLISQMVKIVQMLDLRVKGAVVQQHQVLSANINLGSDEAAKLEKVLQANSLDELELEIKRIRRQIAGDNREQSKTSSAAIEFIDEGELIGTQEKDHQSQDS